MPYVTAVFTATDKSYNVHFIRELTAEQALEHEQTLAEFLKLRQRFSLLHILTLNYRALMSYVDDIRSAPAPDANAEISEANRHLMNYLSSAYAMWQHLQTSLIRDFGRKSEEVCRFQKFIKLLEKQRFEYAFFQDFRNYAQHCGFPVGEMVFTHGSEGRLVAITFSKLTLLREYAGWGKCSLSQSSEDEFELINLAKRHFQIVIQEFSVVIQAVYGKNLDNIESYFLSFHEEARQVHEKAVAKLVLAMPANPNEGTLTFQDIPGNPLAELGLSRKKAKGDIVILS